MSRVAILGVGKVGTAIARTALAAGHDVVIAGSGDPAPVQFIVDVLAPGVAVRTAADAVRGSDIVILAIPLPKLASLDPAMLEGRIVVDAMNHWEPTDGALPAMFDGAASTSAVVAAHLAGARLVKSLGHIGYHEMEDDAMRAGQPGRRAIAAVSDDIAAATAAAAIIEPFGFDVIAAAPLGLGAVLEPGTEIFAGRFEAAEIEARLAGAGAHEVRAIRNGAGEAIAS